MPGIIVGVDGSGPSARALGWAIREGALLHAPVTVLAVHSVTRSPWPSHSVTFPRDPAELEKVRRVAEEMTLKVTSQLGDQRPSSVTVRAVNGYPAKELIDASHRADLVVVGSRGAGGFARLRVGSVSSQVLHHAQCPVVVVPSEK